MMRPRPQWLPLFVWILILWCPSEAWSLNFHWELPVNPSWIRQAENRLEKNWLLWESKYHVFPKEINIIVRLDSKPQRSGSPEWGHTENDVIFLSQALVKHLLGEGSGGKSGDFIDQILRHELAHVFFNSYAEAARFNTFLQEIFALSTSGDFHRIIAHSNSLDTDSLFTSKAIAFFNEHATEIEKSGTSGLNGNPQFARAASRLLIEAFERNTERGRKIDQDFSYMFVGKNKNDIEVQRIARSIFKTLTGNDLMVSSDSHEEGMIVLDGISGMPIFEMGKIDEPLMPGSSLKPSVLVAIDRLRSSRTSRLHDSWVCDVEQESGAHDRKRASVRKWTWQEALVKSCNGFFVDGISFLEKEQDQWHSLLSSAIPRFKQTRNVAPAQAVGLLPGFEMSARELAHLYLRMIDVKPEVIEALHETARSGTLSGLPDSPWFQQRGLLLKSGTVRDINSRPMIGWIVAIKKRHLLGKSSRKNPERADLISIYFKKGRAPSEILGELRRYLNPFIELNMEPNPVQILGLVNEAPVKLGCVIGGQQSQLVDLKIGKSFTCPGNLLEVEFSGKPSDIQKRRYYGTLEKIQVPSHEPAAKFASEKQHRARRGSSLQLQTSLFSYAAHVLASEYPNGRREVLKALALVIQQNARSHPRHPRAICDTTHCQAFNIDWNYVAKGTQRKIIDILTDISDQRLLHWLPKKESATNWFPFSLGGSVQWSDLKTDEEIQTKFRSEVPDAITQTKAVEDANKMIEFHQAGARLKRISCEEFRNQLNLLSCPSEIKKTPGGWLLRGQGEGHSQGLDLVAANTLAAQGLSFDEILRAFYPGVEKVKIQ